MMGASRWTLPVHPEEAGSGPPKDLYEHRMGICDGQLHVRCPSKICQHHTGYQPYSSPRPSATSVAPGALSYEIKAVLNKAKMLGARLSAGGRSPGGQQGRRGLSPQAPNSPGGHFTTTSCGARLSAVAPRSGQAGLVTPGGRLQLQKWGAALFQCAVASTAVDGGIAARELGRAQKLRPVVCSPRPGRDGTFAAPSPPTPGLLVALLGAPLKGAVNLAQASSTKPGDGCLAIPPSASMEMLRSEAALSSGASLSNGAPTDCAPATSCAVGRVNNTRTSMLLMPINSVWALWGFALR